MLAGLRRWHTQRRRWNRHSLSLRLFRAATVRERSYVLSDHHSLMVAALNLHRLSAAELEPTAPRRSSAPDSLNLDGVFVFNDRDGHSPFLNFRPELDFNVPVRLGSTSRFTRGTSRERPLAWTSI